MRASLTRRFSIFFLTLGVTITVILGYWAWSAYLALEKNAVIHQQARVLVTVGEFVSELQSVRFQSAVCLEATELDVKEQAWMTLQAMRHKAAVTLSVLQNQLATPKKPLPVHLQTFAQELPHYISLLDHIRSSVDNDALTVQTSMHDISVVTDFLLSGLYARTDQVSINRPIRTLYELTDLQESLGLLRLGGLLRIEGIYHQAEMLRLKQRLDDSLKALGYCDATLRPLMQDQVFPSEAWQTMLSLQDLVLDAGDGNVSDHDTVSTVSADVWVRVLSENIDQVATLRTGVVETLRTELADQQRQSVSQVVVLFVLWFVVTFLLSWLYWVLVVRCFVGGFQFLDVEVMTLKDQDHRAKFMPIRLPVYINSQEFADLVSVLNELYKANYDSAQYTLHQDRLITIGNMAASMAHEINNPIAGIMMNLTYLSELSLEEEPQEIVQESLQEVQRVAKLIKVMLGFSRRSNPSSHQCELTEVLENVLTITQGFVKRHHAQLTHQLTPIAGVRVQADADAITQIVSNLIHNAVQAMADSECKQLTLDARLLKSSQAGQVDQVLVRVADTGTGIPDAIKQKIFDPFFTTKTAGQGTGLGLSICVKLAHDMGAILTLDESYTAGARFLLYLPIAQATPPSTQAVSTVELHPDLAQFDESFVSLNTPPPLRRS